MGVVRMGPPTELLLQLARAGQINTFIEAGTFHGETASWAAGHFQQVITIEFSSTIYDHVSKKLAVIDNIQVLFGDSRSVLGDIVPQLTASALFWLDSHWSGGETYGIDDECPILQELDIITRSAHPHLLVIDDARLFMAPPPRPHNIEQWPAIDKVIKALQTEARQYYIVIVDDVIVATPWEYRTVLAAYCQELSTRSWRDDTRQRKATPLQQGGDLIAEGSRLIGRHLYARARDAIRPLASLVRPK